VKQLIASGNCYCCQFFSLTIYSLSLYYRGAVGISGAEFYLARIASYFL